MLSLISTADKKDKIRFDSIYVIAQSYNATFFPTTGVYDSGLSAGKIENIKNDDLKYAIMNLYNLFYKKLVYNGEILDDVVDRFDWEKRIYFDEITNKIISWDFIYEYEFKAQIAFLLHRNEIYTRIVNDNRLQIESVIQMISKELNQ